MLRPTVSILDQITESDYISLLKFTRQYTNTKEEAQSALQNAFRIALEKQDQLRNTEYLLPWLRTIAKREALHQQQYYLKLIFYSFIDLQKIEGEENVEKMVHQRILIEAVVKMLNHAAPVYGSILRMHYWEDLSFSEIGTRLGFSAGTVRSYHRRILKRLHKTLSQV